MDELVLEPVVPKPVVILRRLPVAEGAVPRFEFDLVLDHGDDAVGAAAMHRTLLESQFDGQPSAVDGDSEARLLLDGSLVVVNVKAPATMVAAAIGAQQFRFTSAQVDSIKDFLTP